MSGRRNFMILMGAMGAIAGWRAVSPIVGDLFEGDFAFANIDGLEGFRKIDNGAITTGLVDPFFGLDVDPIPPAPLKTSVYDAVHFNKGAGVQVAEFTDYNCPYCKILGEDVHALADTGGITISLHHLPLLGDESVSASRVVLAAGAQKETDALHRRVMATRLRASESYARLVASEEGFDVDALNMDAGTPHIARAKTLAGMFGIIGTPALVVGRTLVIGRISGRRLARLIEAERQAL